MGAMVFLTRSTTETEFQTLGILNLQRVNPPGLRKFADSLCAVSHETSLSYKSRKGESISSRIGAMQWYSKSLCLWLIWTPSVVASFWSSWGSLGSKAEEPVDTSELVSPIINREIQVSVQAPWPSSPYNVLCEAHVFLRDWRFTDALLASDQPLVSFEEMTDHAVQTATEAGISNPLLRFALSMRAQSPTCEMHRGLAADLSADKPNLDAFAVINGQVFVDLESLPEVLEDVTQEERTSYLLPKEVIRPTKSTQFGLVILYANLGSPDSHRWYEALTERDWPLIVRHLGHKDNDLPVATSTALQGYGVRLDIRNVEYKVFDDRKDASDKAAALINVTKLEVDKQNLAPHFLAGVNLTALLQSNDLSDEDAMNLQADLWKTNQAQAQHANLIPPTWQRRQLSIQAATVIANSNQNQLLALKEVSQNLPSVASTLVHVQVPEEVSKVVEPMEKMLQSLIGRSGGGLFINGKPMVVERPSFNVFEMIQRLQKEQERLNHIQDTLEPYFESESAQGALEQIRMAWTKGESFFAKDSDSSDPDDEEPETASASKQVRINVESGEKRAVLYLNDIEKDPAYAQWTTRLEQALMAMQYGMPPSVRRNLFTILAVENPLEGKPTMGSGLAMQLMQGQYPARLAVLVVDDSDVEQCATWAREERPKPDVLCPNDKTSWMDKKTAPSLDELKELQATARDIHRLYAYTSDLYSGEILQAYVQYMSGALAQSRPTDGEHFSLFEVLDFHNEILVGIQVQREKEPPVDLARALLDFDEDSDSELNYFRGVRFAVEKGLKNGMSFLNGRPMPVGDDQDAMEEASALFVEEQKVIFGMVMSKKITESSPKSVYRALLSKQAFPRVHPLLAAPAEGAYIDLSHQFGPESLMVPTTMTGAPLDADAILVVEAVLAYDTEEGKHLAEKFLTTMETISPTTSDGNIAVAYRVVPSTGSAAASPLCQVFASAGSRGSSEVLQALNRNEVVSSDETDSPCSQTSYLDDKMPSANYLVANGRVFSFEGSSFDSTDIDLLLSIQFDQSSAVTKLLSSFVKKDTPYEAVARSTAFLSAAKAESQGRTSPVDTILSIEDQLKIKENPLRFSWNGDCQGDRLQMSVVAIVDPVTETAQRLSPLLQVVRDELKFPLTLILAPTMTVDSESKIPISSYYRFVADPSSHQDGFNSPMARFSNLPTDHVLTVRMDVPEPWDVQQAQSIQDTDNLRCDLKSGCGDEAASGTLVEGSDPYKQRHLTSVEYGLSHLLFSGQCYETTAVPPNGLQLTLSKQSGTSRVVESGVQGVQMEADGSITTPGDEIAVPSHYSDTLVMKTVGYWQLRANPGVWDLKFLKDSRGSEIFDMMEGDVTRNGVRVSGPNTSNNTKRLIMGDFVSRTSTLLVKRKQGYEKANIFSNKEQNESDDDTVHVFSLATGHLYERLLKIMMLSVTKRTSSKVKFWLFENYLSPTFKAAAMAMAERIGCEVAFVTYKWPEWLRGQTEKQRIIWGYKILFLDVLFPLNLKKIIYVDADQVVRGDLKELWDMDLDGAPYGYTPMCDSRETTTGFAFWKTGFWKDHLRGKPYHISALYVVDLERFRRTLVGDQLRATYQQLSADPASLANLDQDLPNFAQHQVPIFSLPQEWLWCESWCSDETKPLAKTIDLCNNPLHKEPKLSMAKRVISGPLFEESWEELDEEVAKYDEEFASRRQ